MKKFVIIFVFISFIMLSLFLGFLFKKSNITNGTDNLMSGNWEKLTDNIYIEKDSIKKYKYTISGWFKMYSSEDTALYYDNTEYYSLIQYEADCVSPALCLLHIKEFDKNDILLLDEPNEHNVCYNGPGGWIHGEVAYKALCKFWK